MDPIIVEARRKYHKELLERGILTIDEKGIVSNADAGNSFSKRVASGIASRLGIGTVQTKSAGQTSGAAFEEVNMDFLKDTFPKLSNLRPGKWKIVRLGNKSTIKISQFAQYEHLDYLDQLICSDPKLAASLGNDYMVTPDILIYRELETDTSINTPLEVINGDVSTYADIRARKGALPILHASISAKFTMRSDRAQNSRTEALGLIRNRKGNLPHIVVVTAEPTPSRIASLALGTGDIDCVYHFALYELIESVKETGSQDSIDLLNELIDGKRLKDISDLPLDLAV